MVSGLSKPPLSIRRTTIFGFVPKCSRSNDGISPLLSVLQFPGSLERFTGLMKAETGTDKLSRPESS